MIKRTTWTQWTLRQKKRPARTVSGSHTETQHPPGARQLHALHPPLQPGQQGSYQDKHPTYNPACEVQKYAENAVIEFEFLSLTFKSVF